MLLRRCVGLGTDGPERQSSIRDDGLFLPRTNGKPLVLRHGSVFFPDEPEAGVSQIASQRGVRQICGERSGLGRSTLPVVVEAVADDGASQGDDGIGASDGPMHAAALEAVADDGLAGAFDDAGGDAQSLGAERRIGHAFAIGGEVVEVFPRLVAGGHMLPQSGDDGIGAALVEFVAPRLAPLRGEVAAGAVDGLGDVEDVLLGVKDVHDLDGVGQVLVGEVPDPGAPSPSTTRRATRSTHRRSSSRSTRLAKSDGARSVSRVAMLSMAPLHEPEPGSRQGDPSLSRPSADQTVTSFTSRVLAEPSACLPTRPAVSDLRIGTPVPSSPT